MKKILSLALFICALPLAATAQETQLYDYQPIIIQAPRNQLPAERANNIGTQRTNINITRQADIQNQRTRDMQRTVDNTRTNMK